MSDLKKEILTKFKRGDTPSRVSDDLLRNGKTQQEINNAFKEIFAEKHDDFLDFLFPIDQFFKNRKVETGKRNFINRVKQSGKKVFWDPAGEIITENSFLGARRKLKEKIQKVIKDPRLPLKFFLLSLSPILIITLISFFNLEKYDSRFLINEENVGGILFIIFLSLAPIFIVVVKTFKFQTDTIKFLIAEKNDWQYSPGESGYRWGKISSLFPQIFRKGNAEQNLSDEFFGTFPGRSPVDFWQGIFIYKNETRSGTRRRKNVSTHRKDILAIRLPKKIRVSFALIHESIFHKFFNFFRSKEIDVESAEFNRNFSVYYDGKRMEKENDIFSILSPTVQFHLVDMKKKMGKFSIYFIKDICFFVFPNKFFPKMKTNFLWEARLHPADQENFHNKITNLLEICGEIVPFLK